MYGLKKCLSHHRIFKHFNFSKWRNVHNCGVNDDLFGLTTEEKDFRKTIHDFGQRELVSYVDDIDRDNGWVEQRTFWRKLGQIGLFGITVPTKYGGLGYPYFKQFLAFEEISRISAAIALSYGAQSNLCLNQLSLNASDEQKAKYFPKLISGEHIGALAMSEVESGSDVVSLKLQAKREKDYYILNGSKFWITNGPDADILVVYAKTDENCLPEHGITTFIIEKGMEGFSTMPKLDKLGMRGSNTGELVFDNCKVPIANIVGKVNGGIYVLFKGLDIERALLAAGSLGIMQACLDLALPLRCSEKIHRKYKDKIEEMYTQTSVCRAYTYSVVRAIDKGNISSKDCAGCVLYASEMATQIASKTMQCIGVNCYTQYHAAGRYLRDAKLNEIGGGTNEIRRWLIGRRINEDYMQ